VDFTEIQKIRMQEAVHEEKMDLEPLRIKRRWEPFTQQ
jgi:hypothetical protein